MGVVTIVLGVLLSVLGVVGFVVTGSEHYTALIPSGFGVVFVILGALARQEWLRMHVMHAAAVLGLIGFVATARGLIGLAHLLAGGEVERPAAAVSQSLMALACLAYVGLCVRSFIEARRRRLAGKAAGPNAG
jgi:hypothetical protein